MSRRLCIALAAALLLVACGCSLTEDAAPTPILPPATSAPPTPPPPPPPARFAQFVAALAGRYSRAPYNVHAWEFFNEPDSTYPPNHTGGFGLYGDQYAALLRAAVPGIRAIDPQARVLLGGLAYEWFMD